MSDIQMGGINFANNLADQLCHTYYKTGYEKGKVDTLKKIADEITKMVETESLDARIGLEIALRVINKSM